MEMFEASIDAQTCMEQSLPGTELVNLSTSLV